MTHAEHILLSEHELRFIRSQIDQGRYREPSDVLHAGLRLLQEREAKLHNLRSALDEAEASGHAGPLDMDAIKRTARSIRSGTIGGSKSEE